MRFTGERRQRAELRLILARQIVAQYCRRAIVKGGPLAVAHRVHQQNAGPQNRHQSPRPLVDRIATVFGHRTGQMRIRNDGQEPVIARIDGHKDEVLVEQVHVLRPVAHVAMSAADKVVPAVLSSAAAAAAG